MTKLYAYVFWCCHLHTAKSALSNSININIYGRSMKRRTTKPTNDLTACRQLCFLERHSGILFRVSDISFNTKSSHKREDLCPKPPLKTNRHTARLTAIASSLYPERAKYPWIGCNTNPGASGEYREERVAHGCELFMAADAKMITIGGGLVSILTCCVTVIACIRSGRSTPG